MLDFNGKGSMTSFKGICMRKETKQYAIIKQKLLQGSDFNKNDKKDKG